MPCFGFFHEAKARQFTETLLLHGKELRLSHKPAQQATGLLPYIPGASNILIFSFN
jgi:hypothetical protein